MNISMTFDIPADVAADVVDAVRAILEAHSVAVCREVVESSEALKKLTEELTAQRNDVVTQLKGLRRDIRNFDVPA